jgi:predicted RNA binding protein YcfA (HicA-like mRNA interferase family)
MTSKEIIKLLIKNGFVQIKGIKNLKHSGIIK